jgi:hypothetical protein
MRKIFAVPFHFSSSISIHDKSRRRCVQRACVDVFRAYQSRSSMFFLRWRLRLRGPLRHLTACRRPIEGRPRACMLVTTCDTPIFSTLTDVQCICHPSVTTAADGLFRFTDGKRRSYDNWQSTEQRSAPNEANLDISHRSMCRRPIEGRPRACMLVTTCDTPVFSTLTDVQCICHPSVTTAADGLFRFTDGKRC